MIETTTWLANYPSITAPTQRSYRDVPYTKEPEVWVCDDSVGQGPPNILLAAGNTVRQYAFTRSYVTNALL